MKDINGDDIFGKRGLGENLDELNILDSIEIGKTIDRRNSNKIDRKIIEEILNHPQFGIFLDSFNEILSYINSQKSKPEENQLEALLARHNTAQGEIEKAIENKHGYRPLHIEYSIALIFARKRPRG